MKRDKTDLRELIHVLDVDSLQNNLKLIRSKRTEASKYYGVRIIFYLILAIVAWNIRIPLQKGINSFIPVIVIFVVTGILLLIVANQLILLGEENKELQWYEMYLNLLDRYLKKGIREFSGIDVLYFLYQSEWFVKQEENRIFNVPVVIRASNSLKQIININESAAFYLYPVELDLYWKTLREYRNILDNYKNIIFNKPEIVERLRLINYPDWKFNTRNREERQKYYDITENIYLVGLNEYFKGIYRFDPDSPNYSEMLKFIDDVDSNEFIQYVAQSTGRPLIEAGLASASHEQINRGENN